MIDQCKRGLLRLLAPGALNFFPATAEFPEYAGVMSFADELGPNAMLYVVRAGNQDLELDWQSRDLKFHRTGTIIQSDLVATWPALLASVEDQEVWPPSKAYRLMKSRKPDA